jgi:hypothetical protein
MSISETSKTSLIMANARNFEELRSQLTKQELTRLKNSRDDAYFLNITLGTLSVGLLLLVG